MTSDVYQFFVSTPPGFEKLTSRELFRIYSAYQGKLTMDPPEDWIMYKGGIEFRCDLRLGCLLNYHLKTANRILMRLTTGECKTLNELQKYLEESGLKSIVGQCEIETAVSSRSSKLNHERKIKKAVQEWQVKTWKKKSDGVRKQRIDLRFFRDQLTVSIDSSGDRLHKRGWRTKAGPAPMRENLAAGLLMSLFAFYGDHDEKLTLVDPMMGSGTLLKEAFDLDRPNFSRDYAFEGWQSLVSIKDLMEPIPKLVGEIHFAGSEIDSKTYELIAKNKVNKDGKKEQWNLENCDFRDLEVDKTSGQRFVISNLPYGDRISKIKKLKPEELLQKLIEQFEPERMGLVAKIDDRYRIDRELPRGWLILDQIYFENGGIPVVFKVYAKDSSFLASSEHSL